jgi:hypothetical protein
MWRLSWITFIFLPLTFTVGFFGMNVDAFSGDPSIKWFFISAIPLMLTVFILWYAIKHTLASQRQDPLRRGVYESLFHELSLIHPTLWSRRGPRDGIIPIGFFSATKWRLVTTWFAPDRTILSRGYDPGDEELGVWSRIKRALVRRWLGQITVMPMTTAAASAPDLESAASGLNTELGAIRELLSLATPVAMADGEPTAASRIGANVPLARLRSLSPTRSDGRPGSRQTSGGGSGVMVEEKGASEDEHSGSEDGRGGRDTMQRLTVPLYPGGAGIIAGGL